MTNKYLKPMLDPGSPRVFNCNEMTRRVLEKNPQAKLFFVNRGLNSIVLIKDTVPEPDRRPGMPPIGTKLYFPFNEHTIYEGGRTIFLHDKGVEYAISEYCGEESVTKESLAKDIHYLKVLSSLPSLDPFLMKDVFIKEHSEVDEAYFEVSEEVWEEIELYMLQKFEPLILAAFPKAESSDEKARMLIDKIWEARDLEALMPLVDAFRLPKDDALDIFASWKGIVYYSYQFSKVNKMFIELVKWVNQDVSSVGISTEEIKASMARLTLVRDQLRIEWQKSDEYIRSYQSSYDKMFKDKTSSTEFLSFLKNSKAIYWDLGNSLGKVNTAIYCWDVMSTRYDGRKLPWAPRQEIITLLAKVLEPEKKVAKSVAW